MLFTSPLLTHWSRPWSIVDEQLNKILKFILDAFGDDGTSYRLNTSVLRLAAHSPPDPVMLGLLGGDLILAKLFHDGRIRAAMLEGRVYAVESEGKIVAVSVWFRRPMKVYKTYVRTYMTVRQSVSDDICHRYLARRSVL